MKNSYFGHGDAVVLFSMLRHLRPKRILEVGSGFSSALMLDTNDLHCDPKMELNFVEPYPDRLEKLLTPSDRSSARIISAPVQEGASRQIHSLGTQRRSVYRLIARLQNRQRCESPRVSVLPRLQNGVVVHFHDIFYPFEYPLAWVREGRSWNEMYLLRAFLQYNRGFEIMLFNSCLWYEDPALVKAHMPLLEINPGDPFG